MRIQHPLQLIASIVLCHMAGAVGSLFTMSSVSTWYLTLSRPALNPPGWVFGPVWFVLYTLMGVALYLVWQRGIARERVRQALTVFGVQLVLNALWSVLFFGIQQPGAAFVDIVLLWGAILATMGVFYPLSKVATYFLVPYFLWVSFAAYLNYAIWVLNA